MLGALVAYLTSCTMLYISLVRWLASSNHKDIGLAYVMSALLGGVIGTTLSAHFGMSVLCQCSLHDTKLVVS